MMEKNEIQSFFQNERLPVCSVRKGDVYVYLHGIRDLATAEILRESAPGELLHKVCVC